MKTVRIFLLVLLALMLPLRGALANIAHCAGSPSGFGPALTATQDHAGHGYESHGHAQSHSDHEAAAAADDSASADDCNLCTASCSATPYMACAPVVAAPKKLADAVFPSLLAPPSSHPTDGQERPPRSI